MKQYTEIVNGHPVTHNSFGGVEDDRLDTVDPETAAALREWIQTYISPIRINTVKVCTSNSYVFKHMAETMIGRYVSNNLFKDAMLAAGYKPNNPKALNWQWRFNDRDVGKLAALAYGQRGAHA